jgi:hypothetical protein
MKLAALEHIIAAEGVEGAGVMYVGDSITDAPPLAAVRAWGGVSLSCNGNGYALAAAEFATASPDAGVAAELAKAFAGGGRDGVEAAVRAWPKPKKGEKPTGRARARVGLVAEEPDALAEAGADPVTLTPPWLSATVLCKPYFVRNHQEARWPSRGSL